MSRRRGPRRLSAEETELWRQVVEHAVPLRPDRTSKPETPAVDKPQRPTPEPIAPFLIQGRGAGGGRITTETAPALSQQPLAMDHKAFTRMRRGKLAVEGRIDLHGMTLDQAQPTLINFILGAHAMGKRLVLVITGKGQGKRHHEGWHSGHGVLKRQVPHWLRMAPLAGVVLQVSEAHQSHGGSGAYYVYLRRNR